jgi:DNA-binding HxlR family transcriptional regulator
MTAPATLSAWYSARAITAAEWAPAIMWALRDGALHYRDLLLAVRRIEPSEGWPRRHVTLHDSMLARTLRRMTDEGLICRVEDRSGFPPAVCYSLSEAGRDFLHAAAALAAWSDRHAGIVAQAKTNRLSPADRDETTATHFDAGTRST